MANMTLKEQFRRYKQNLADKLYEAGLVLENEYHRIVAQDTLRLDESIHTDPVVDRGNILSCDVGSSGVPYAIFVDQGVKGKTYNYHRRTGGGRVVIYSGVGLHYMSRGLENKTDQIYSIIRSAKVL